MRFARVEDAAEIAAVNVAGWRETFAGLIPDEMLAALSVDQRAETWRDQLANPRDGTFVLVAEDDDGTLLGFGSGGPQRSKIDGFSGELYSLYVRSSVHRRGTGRALAMAVARELVARGHTSMIVWVFKANPAVGFYERLGGVRAAECEVDYGGRLLPEWGMGWTDLGALVGAAAD